MKSVGKVFILALCAGVFACQHQTSNTMASNRQLPTRGQALQDFDNIKFGMFIHWGLYAIPAGVWKGEEVRHIGEWIMHDKQIPVREYEQLAKQFNPVKFNADEWAQLASDAGMKYLVITAKHHDGFAMYGSKASKYNIVDATPYGKDPMKELSAACSRRGIKFGFYYSHAQDWHEPNAAGNDWDFPKDRNYQIYLKNKAIPQVKELLTGYGPLFLIWFDTPRLLTKGDAMELDSLVHGIQPSCLLNSRIGYGLGDYRQTGDNAIPTQVFEKKWEVPATLNDTWGYKVHDHHWKDPRDLIQKLADIVSKGGNYLLNVGPTAEGVIPAESQKILREIGAWMKVNGESIYNTKPSPFFYNDITWRCTVKPNKLYFHILNWPGKQLSIEGLKSKVTKAYFLENGNEVNFSQEGNSLKFELPEKPLNEYNTVLVAEIADSQAILAPGYSYKDQQKIQNLYAWNARFIGSDIKYDRKTQSCTNFIDSPSPRNELYWYMYGTQSGDFYVDMEYNCADSIAGSKFAVRKGYSKTDDNEVLEHTLEGTDGKFLTKRLGEISIEPDHEEVVIKFGLADYKSAGVKVRRIVLTRK